jgi:hypothetical protein
MDNFARKHRNNFMVLASMLALYGCVANQAVIKPDKVDAVPGFMLRNDSVDSHIIDYDSLKAKDNVLPSRSFKSDGCTFWPDDDWLECCIYHDVSYWIGGSRQERLIADLELKKCASKKGHPVIAQIMYWGVRLGGVWWLPTRFRWGFGWDYPQSGPPGKPY